MATQWYIFLDVDGVLHPASWGTPRQGHQVGLSTTTGESSLQAAPRGLWARPDGLPFSCLAVFEHAVRAHLEDLEIIISSSWREEPALYESILEAMSPDVRMRVTGATPVGHERPWEINRWLELHGQPSWRAIVIDDDNGHRWRMLDPRAVLFLTHTSKGFTVEDAKRLEALLEI